MKCGKCRYLNKENFENTRLKTCKVMYYIIQNLKKEGWKDLYTTDALQSEEQNCILEEIFQDFR